MKNWREDAVCAQIDPGLWFPDAGSDGEVAKRICMEECPVQEICLADALDRHEPIGVWGGLGPRQRRELRRAPA